MSVDPSFSFDLYPGLDAELEAAYRRNVESGNASPETVASSGLAAVIAEQTAHRSSFEAASLSPDFKELLSASHQAAKDLFISDAGLEVVPELSDSLFEEVDWPRLGAAYEVIHHLGLDPEIVMSPRGLEPDTWKDIFKSLPGTKNGGLYIDSSVDNNWSTIDPVGVQGWTISVLAASPEPTVKNVSHDLSKVERSGQKVINNTFNALGNLDTEAIRNNYPTVPEYLTLQALRLKAGKEPIDAKTYTWLKGTFDNNSKAPYACWRPGDGQVDVDWDGPGDRDGGLGVRPAVRVQGLWS